MSKTQYYILIKPSCRGMGSDSDYALVTEENMHKILSEEEIESNKGESEKWDETKM